MVSIVKRKIQDKIYYYLSYSYRERGKVKLIEKSLGREIPTQEHLEDIKERFIVKIVLKRWNSIIEKFKRKYLRKFKDIPQIIKSKNLTEFGVRFTHNSNKIEGSTLTLREVALAINEKDVIINKSTNDINEAQLHMMCYEDMIATKEDLSLDLIIEWHKKLFSMHINRSNLAGIIRKDIIVIVGSKYTPPIYPQPLIEDLFKWYDENKDLINPVLLACLMHLRFETIHPFNDGNGRMGRLLINYILYKNDYSMFNITAKIRNSYYKALEKANIYDDEMYFVNWFFKNYIKSFNEIKVI